MHQARRALSYVSEILARGVSTCICKEDFTETIKGSIPRREEVNLAAVRKPKDFKKLLKAMDLYVGSNTVKNLLFIHAYLFQRPSEMRGMLREEVDLKDKIWTISAKRMKMREEHIVHLPKQAIAIIEEQLKLPTATKFVFPSLRGEERPVSENTIRVALLSIGYGGDTHTAHGFRATARTILDEELEVPEKYIERHMAHKLKDPLGNAYNRTEHLKRRKEMIQKWCDYIDELRGKCQIKLSLLH